MGTSVIVPWRAGCPHREAAWRWCRHRWETLDLEVIEGTYDQGPWRKATAVADGLRRAAGDLLIVADADVWCDGVTEAIAAARAEGTWAVPHRQVCRLNEESTAHVINGADPDGLELDERPYKGQIGGGIVILPRALYDDIPLDPRFTGWGQEDASWAAALRSLHGPPWLGTAPLWHLWHPPQPRLTRRTGSHESQALHRRYAVAKSRPDDMRTIIEEAKRWTPPGSCPSPPRSLP